jgi:RNA polymerase sigma-70 factor (ECF subfamily)
MSQDSQENHEQYQSLLQKMAQGSEAALAEFYCIFESKIFAFANIRLNDSQEASDLLNDVMWEVWRGAGRFEGRSSVTTWVFGIAHHKVIVFELKGSGAFIADLEVCAGQAGVFVQL